MQGSLAPDIEPQTLFDVPINDEAAILIESKRVQTMLRAVDENKQAAFGRPSRPKSAAVLGPGGMSAREPEVIDPVRWEARIELDRQRLAFYSLTNEARAALLQAQIARREAAQPRETDEERRAREADAERQRALEAARAARSEAERLVGEELARLIGIERSISTAQQAFKARREELAMRRDTLLGLQRHARDAKSHAGIEADSTYDSLRGALRNAREQLSAAIDDLDSGTTNLPALGADPLTDVPVDIPTDVVRERRKLVERQLDKAQAEEHSVRAERASTLLDEVTQLNRERLGLLPYLSREKRAAVTGFTEVGLEQAHAESRHLALILRYHHHIGTDWLRALRDDRSAAMPSLWRVLLVAVPWLLVWILFGWWRRRSLSILEFVEERTAEVDRIEQRTESSAIHRLVRFVRGVHRQLEWLLFYGITVWLLPASVKELLEVQLLIVVLGWPLAGALIVNIINALATPSDTSGTHKPDNAGNLRHRSLSLVGRVVVLFALILVLSARLVGEGTIYRWVLSTCWFSAIPVFLILVRWWRQTVFQRVELVRRKTPLEVWILANQSGWKSFFAAMLAASRLFALGIYKTVRSWLSEFNIARRAHAYLFKRGLERLANEQGNAVRSPLNAQSHAMLAPDGHCDEWLPCPADELLQSIQQQCHEGRHGAVAIVGDLGIGKSSLVARLSSLVEGSVVVKFTHDSSVATVREATGETSEASHALRHTQLHPRLVILDDVHSIIRPVLGGLRRFDELLAYVRRHATQCLWIFVVDQVSWPFLKRARDSRPLFDEVQLLKPWNDAQIGGLIRRRCQAAQIEPTFDDLLDKLPPTADEVDLREALEVKQAGYFRMVWDFARGNPALALEAWRSSLVEDAGGIVRVRSLQAPDAAQLEALPDSALFIFRSILQMAPTSAAEVAQAARITEQQVRDTFRFGQAHGYFTESNGRVAISWTWLRAIIVLLKRRHLLVNS